MKHILITIAYFAITSATWPTLAWLLYGLFDTNYLCFPFWLFNYVLFLALDGLGHEMQEIYNLVKEKH